MTKEVPLDQDHDFASDLLRGASAIAGFMFGETDTRHRRVIYEWSEGGKIPTFKIGATICARKSTLREHVAALENGNMARHAAG